MCNSLHSGITAVNAPQVPRSDSFTAGSGFNYPNPFSSEGNSHEGELQNRFRVINHEKIWHIGGVITTISWIPRSWQRRARTDLEFPRALNAGYIARARAFNRAPVPSPAPPWCFTPDLRIFRRRKWISFGGRDRAHPSVNTGNTHNGNYNPANLPALSEIYLSPKGEGRTTNARIIVIAGVIASGKVIIAPPAWNARSAGMITHENAQITRLVEW